MKILILSNKPPFPPKDGGAIAIFNLAKGMADHYHFIHILAMNTSKHKVQASDIQNFNNLRFSMVNVDTTIKTKDLTINLVFSKQPYNAQRFVSAEYLEKLEPIILAGQYNLIQLEGPYLGFCIPLIRKISNAKIVLRAHNIEHLIWQRIADETTKPIKRKYIRLLASRLRRFEAFIFEKL